MTAHLYPREKKMLGVCIVRGRKKIRRSKFWKENKCMKAVRICNMSVCVQGENRRKKYQKYNVYNEGEEREKA